MEEEEAGTKRGAEWAIDVQWRKKRADGIFVCLFVRECASIQQNLVNTLRAHCTSST